MEASTFSCCTWVLKKWVPVSQHLRGRRKNDREIPFFPIFGSTS